MIGSYMCFFRPLQNNKAGAVHQKSFIYKLSLCVSFVSLVVLLVFLLMSFLAKMHMNMIYERLENDIQEEMDNNFHSEHMSPNESKLRRSQYVVSKFQQLLMLAIIWYALKIPSLLISIIAIITHDHLMMRLFLAIGLVGFVFAGCMLSVIFQHVYYYDVNIPTMTILSLCGGYLIILPGWIVLYRHYIYLRDYAKKTNSLPTSKSVVGTGGLIHSFDVKVLEEKPPSV